MVFNSASKHQKMVAASPWPSETQADPWSALGLFDGASNAWDVPRTASICVSLLSETHNVFICFYDGTLQSNHDKP